MSTPCKTLTIAALLAASAAAEEPPPAAVSVKTDEGASPTALSVKPVTLLDERITLGPGRGLTVKTPGGDYALTLRARLQLRDTYVHDQLDTNELGVKTVRFFVQGNVFVPELKYLVQLALGTSDYEAGNPSPLFDAFVEYTKLRELNVRVGQYFVPFDRARTVRESALQMVDRQIAVRELNLDRDVGVMLSSQDLFGLNQLLAYHLFIGGGDGRNRVGAQMVGPLLVARLAVRPFGAFDDDSEGDLERLGRPRLSVGAAFAYNVHTTRKQSTFGDVLTLGTVDYVHAAADVTFKWAGFSLLAEVIYRGASTAVLEGTSSSGAVLREYSRSGWGWFVQGGAMVSRFVELTARWDQLYAAPGTDPSLVALAATQGRQVGAGLNVYLLGHALKVQADWFYVWGYGAVPGRHTVRAALDASF